MRTKMARIRHAGIMRERETMEYKESTWDNLSSKMMITGGEGKSG